MKWITYFFSLQSIVSCKLRLMSTSRQPLNTEDFGSATAWATFISLPVTDKHAVLARRALVWRRESKPTIPVFFQLTCILLHLPPSLLFWFLLGWMKAWMSVLLILGFQRKSIVEIITVRALPQSCQWSGLHWKAWRTISIQLIVMWWVKIFFLSFCFCFHIYQWDEEIYYSILLARYSVITVMFIFDDLCTIIVIGADTGQSTNQPDLFCHIIVNQIM